ncbi:MAG: NADH-quinone oxidoreductase subunit L [Calditrichaeota bacterium]|nr:MAG: NADH-quinone oxidoreductase subunit L [Calditrichota bacterium]
MTEHSYLIVLLPAFSFLMIVFFLRWKEKIASLFSIAMIVTSLIMSISVLFETIARNGEAYTASFTMAQLGSFKLQLGLLIDPLTAMMLVVVTAIGTCVEIYSIGYMKDDPRFSRFFAYLSLFLFSMLGLVVSDNFFMTFIFWELVGLTSYLLIGFWFEKKSAADACKKAFLTTRVGDLGFLVGLLLIMYYTGTFNYEEVFAKIGMDVFPPAMLTLAAIGVFCGAIGKSAQFPLHTWLPDAMEGPTPVSAIVHSATMVAAGVYLTARAMTVFVASADASFFVAVIGVVTSLLAATIALVQVDIKRILAYSTVSQLGYMIMALGLYGYDTANGHHSPGFYAGTFHLMTHAFFKSLLFMGAGSVIHAVHTNDIRDMGGLLKKMPITAPTFLIGSLSIAGFPLTSGFFSKDEIVAATFGHPVFTVLTLLIAFMTAFYMWRLCFLTFFGKPRDEHRYEHAHESPKTMAYPLIFLAFMAVFVGWTGIPALSHGFASFVFHAEPYHPHADWMNYIVSSIVGLSGIGLAWLMYYKRKIDPDKLAERFKPIYTLFWNKWYFDELYDIIIVKPILAIGRFFWSFDANVVDGAVNGTAKVTLLWADLKWWFDRWIVDGAVNGCGWIVRAFGSLLKYIQSGRMQFYGLFILFFIVAAGIYKFESAYLNGWIFTDFLEVTTLFVILIGFLSYFAKTIVPESTTKPKREE